MPISSLRESSSVRLDRACGVPRTITKRDSLGFTYPRDFHLALIDRRICRWSSKSARARPAVFRVRFFGYRLSIRFQDADCQRGKRDTLARCDHRMPRPDGDDNRARIKRSGRGARCPRLTLRPHAKTTTRNNYRPTHDAFNSYVIECGECTTMIFEPLDASIQLVKSRYRRMIA